MAGITITSSALLAEDIISPRMHPIRISGTRIRINQKSEPRWFGCIYEKLGTFTWRIKDFLIGVEVIVMKVVMLSKNVKNTHLIYSYHMNHSVH